MTKIFTIAFLITISGQVFAQQARTQTPPPLPFREVSGIVKDAHGQTVVGATIILA